MKCYECGVKLCKYRTCSHNCNYEQFGCLCNYCYMSPFPFSTVDDAEFKEIVSHEKMISLKEKIRELNSIDTHLIGDSYIGENDYLDPDVNFYAQINPPKSKYLTTSKFNNAMYEDISNMSMLHVNCRSLRKIFDKLLLRFLTLNCILTL